MDLLDKIRHKGRQEQIHQNTDASLPLKEVLPESAARREVVVTLQLSDDKKFVPDDEKLAFHEDISQALPPVQHIVTRSPLEMILAGREAAGCGEDLQLASEDPSNTEQDTYQEFLCFKVSDEVFGIDIMDIKELIKPREVTKVPRTPSYVSGIISLRGVIIPIIDMQNRLGLVRKTVTAREKVIIVRQGESFSGLLVNEIIQVVRVSKDDIEAAPIVLEGIERDFVTGIGRANGGKVILLNIRAINDIEQERYSKVYESVFNAQRID